jgi:hypothetical protein
MGNNNRFQDITIQLEPKRDCSIHQEPTARPTPRASKSRAGVLGCLLLLAATEAAAVHWILPQIVAAEEAPVVSARAKAPAIVVTARAPAPAQEQGTADAVQPAAPAAVLAVSEAPSALSAARSQRKQRECDGLVRDANALQANHPALAVELFDIALAIDARNPHAHAGRAEALLRMNKPAEARLAIAEALRIRPKRERYLELQSEIHAAPIPAKGAVVATR